MKYRVAFNPVIGSHIEEFISSEYDSLSKAEIVLNEIANYTLNLHDQEVFEAYSNYGEVQEFVDGEWLAYHY